MRIQHNIPAMNAYRNYNTNVKSLQGNLQKLSSGYKINKAGDDAAGLAISEKMRAQITGLEVAQKNAKDGISLVQTAEGAMTEIHTMLNRMFSLAEQSANGTYDNEVDRVQLNNEFDKLKEEIDRIADATNFNGKKLLNGKIGQEEAAGGAAAAAADVEASVGTQNDAALSAPTFAFDAAVSDDDKTAINAALEDKKLSLVYDTTAGGANTFAAGDSITISGDAISSLTTAGYSVKVKAANGTTWMAVPSTATVARASNHSAANSTLPESGNLEFQILDGSNNVLGTFSTGAPGTMTNTGGTNTSEINFGKPAETTTKAELKAGGNKDLTTDYGIEKIDFGTTEVAKDADVKVEFTAAKELKVTVGKDIFQSAAVTAADITGTGDELTLTNTKAGSTDTITVKLADGQTKISNTAATITPDTVGKIGEAAGKSTSGLRLRVGDSTEDYDDIYVDIKSMKIADLTGMEGSKTAEDGIVLKDLSVSDPDEADKAMGALKDMINYVSNERGNLGAAQNRLDHTINNLSTMQENIQDAEATIRDVDVAEEMMKYTKNNILVQSAQAMLAQANQLPQGVLQLLG